MAQLNAEMTQQNNTESATAEPAVQSIAGLLNVTYASLANGVAYDKQLDYPFYNDCLSMLEHLLSTSDFSRAHKLYENLLAPMNTRFHRELSGMNYESPFGTVTDSVGTTSSLRNVGEEKEYVLANTIYDDLAANHALTDEIVHAKIHNMVCMDELASIPLLLQDLHHNNYTLNSDMFKLLFAEYHSKGEHQSVFELHKIMTEECGVESNEQIDHYNSFYTPPPPTPQVVKQQKSRNTQVENDIKSRYKVTQRTTQLATYQKSHSVDFAQNATISGRVLEFNQGLSGVYETNNSQNNSLQFVESETISTTNNTVRSNDIRSRYVDPDDTSTTNKFSTVSNNKSTDSAQQAVQQVDETVDNTPWQPAVTATKTPRGAKQAADSYATIANKGSHAMRAYMKRDAQFEAEEELRLQKREAKKLARQAEISAERVKSDLGTQSQVLKRRTDAIAALSGGVGDSDSHRGDNVMSSFDPDAPQPGVDFGYELNSSSQQVSGGSGSRFRTTLPMGMRSRDEDEDEQITLNDLSLSLRRVQREAVTREESDRVLREERNITDTLFDPSWLLTVNNEQISTLLQAAIERDNEGFQYTNADSDMTVAPQPQRRAYPASSPREFSQELEHLLKFRQKHPESAPLTTARLSRYFQTDSMDTVLSTFLDHPSSGGADDTHYVLQAGCLFDLLQECEHYTAQVSDMCKLMKLATAHKQHTYYDTLYALANSRAETQQDKQSLVLCQIDNLLAQQSDSTGSEVMSFLSTLHASGEHMVSSYYYAVQRHCMLNGLYDIYAQVEQLMREHNVVAEVVPYVVKKNVTLPVNVTTPQLASASTFTQSSEEDTQSMVVPSSNRVVSIQTNSKVNRELAAFLESFDNSASRGSHKSHAQSTPSDKVHNKLNYIDGFLGNAHYASLIPPDSEALKFSTVLRGAKKQPYRKREVEKEVEKSVAPPSSTSQSASSDTEQRLTVLHDLNAEGWTERIRGLLVFDHVENAVLVLEGIHAERFHMTLELYEPLLRYFYERQMHSDVAKIGQLMAMHGVSADEEWTLRVQECALTVQIQKGFYPSSQNTLSSGDNKQSVEVESIHRAMAGIHSLHEKSNHISVNRQTLRGEDEGADVFRAIQSADKTTSGGWVAKISDYILMNHADLAVEMLKALHESETAGTQTEDFNENFGVVKVTPEMYQPLFTHYLDTEQLLAFDVLLMQMQNHDVAMSSDVHKLIKRFRKLYKK
eukprot:gene25269-31703_t